MEDKSSVVEGGGANMAEQGRRKAGMTRCELGLRLMGLGLTLAAAVVAGVNKESTEIPVVIAPTLPTLHVPVTAKWQYMSSNVYFVVSNAVACSYAAISVVHGIIAGTPGDSVVLVTSIIDLVMVALLFSADGAAAAVGLIGLHGNSHVRWNKVCNVFGTFCSHMTAAFALSLVGSFLFLWLVMLKIVKLHKKTR